MIENVIMKGIGGFYYVYYDGHIVECRARGKFRKMGVKPMVGDRVKISVDQDMEHGAVEEILERKNFLVRPPVCNIDTIVIVVSATKPEPDFYMIDKLIVTAERNNIEVIIAVNKTDLKSADEIVDIYEKAGYSVYSLCAETNEGVDALKEALAKKVCAFAGNSGVGKSSLLNRFGLSVQTGDISRIKRGKHTTRHVEIFKAENDTFVMDTPGFSILDITDLSADDAKAYFKEFENYADKCKFSGCNHYGTKPDDCAVSDALKKGFISKSRYESYTKLYEYLREKDQWKK